MRYERVDVTVMGFFTGHLHVVRTLLWAFGVTCVPGLA